MPITSCRWSSYTDMDGRKGLPPSVSALSDSTPPWIFWCPVFQVCFSLYCHISHIACMKRKQETSEAIWWYQSWLQQNYVDDGSIVGWRERVNMIFMLIKWIVMIHIMYNVCSPFWCLFVTHESTCMLYWNDRRIWEYSSSWVWHGLRRKKWYA